MATLDQQSEYWNSAGAAKIFTHPLDPSWLTTLEPDARILDYGCGYGCLAGELHRRGFTAVEGVDLSSALIARARRCSVAAAAEAGRQSGGCFGQRVRRRLDLLRGAPAAQRQTHRPQRPVGAQAHGGQHWGWVIGARVAGRAGRRRDLGRGRQQLVPARSVDADVQRVRQARRYRAVEVDPAGQRVAKTPVQGVAQLRDAGGFAVGEVAACQLG